MGILEILIEIFGGLLVKYLEPFLEEKSKTYLEQVLPTVEHWVQALETTTLKGDAKRNSAIDFIIKDLEKNGIPVIQSSINTAIELVVNKMKS